MKIPIEKLNMPMDAMRRSMNKLNTSQESGGMSGARGPSSDYYRTISRFESILADKLGMRRQAATAQTFEERISNRRLDGGGVLSGVLRDVRAREGQGPSAADLDVRFAGTPLEGLGQTFIDAERAHGVSAWFLAALAIHESASGTSAIARDKNNVFGYGAYDGSPYESAVRFSNVAEGVDTVAAYMSRAYLSEDGAHYNGVSVEGIGTDYASDPLWGNKVGAIMRELMAGKKE